MGTINRDGLLSIELMKPTDMPAVVMIRWPAKPSVTGPNGLPAVANAVMGVLGEAAGRLTNPEM